MTTVNERSIGLPAPTRTHEALPARSVRTEQSLPVRKAEPATLALPGAAASRPVALPVRKVMAPENAAARGGLPGSSAKPAVTTAPVTPRVAEVSQALPAPIKRTAEGLPSFTRKTVSDLPPRTEALPAPVRTVPAVTTPAPEANPAQALPPKVQDVRQVQALPVVAPKAPTAGEDVTEPKPQTKRVAAPSVKEAVKKQKVNNKMSFRPTERDREWLSCIYRYNLVTTNHIAYRDGISPDSARKRLTVLLKQGLIRHDARRSARVWQITQEGIDFIRERGKVGTKFPSLLKYPHTMAIATIGITLEKGGPAAAEIVGNLLSEAPRVIITEKEMQVMEGRRERQFIINNWDRLVDDLMHDEKFPVHRYSSVLTQAHYETWTEADWEVFLDTELQEKEVLEARFRGPDKDDRNHTGYCHIVTSHNPKLISNRNVGGKDVQGSTTHRPDALIVLPHIVQEDGTVTGGSIAIEIELNNKSTKAEYKNSILHQYSSRVYSKVFWYFDDPEAKRMFQEAMKELAAMHNPPFTLEEAKDYFRPFNLVLLNADLDAHGLYG